MRKAISFYLDIFEFKLEDISKGLTYVGKMDNLDLFILGCILTIVLV
jgi:hypothetical protein